jgi:hypothetical protein
MVVLPGLATIDGMLSVRGQCGCCLRHARCCVPVRLRPMRPVRLQVATPGELQFAMRGLCCCCLLCASHAASMAACCCDLWRDARLLLAACCPCAAHTSAVTVRFAARGVYGCNAQPVRGPCGCWLRCARRAARAAVVCPCGCCARRAARAAAACGSLLTCPVKLLLLRRTARMRSALQQLAACYLCAGAASAAAVCGARGAQRVLPQPEYARASAAAAAVRSALAMRLWLAAARSACHGHGAALRLWVAARAPARTVVRAASEPASARNPLTRKP